MKYVCMFCAAFLGVWGCGSAPTEAPSAPVASSTGNEEPSVICPNRTREDDLGALAFEMMLFDRIVREYEQGSPEDAERIEPLVNSMSRIVRYREHDSACAVGRVVEALASNCRRNVRHCYHEMLLTLVREADALCPENPREAGTLAHLIACGLAD